MKSRWTLLFVTMLGVVLVLAAFQGQPGGVYLPMIWHFGPSTTSTPTSTPTRTPTPTRGPTRTPTPTPTPTIPPLVILPDTSSYVTAGYIHVIGEVQNNGSQNARSVRVAGNFFNNSGGFVGTGTAYTDLGYIRPGDKACFELFLAEPVGWTYYEFEMPTYSFSATPRPNITIFNDSGSATPYNSYTLIGQARNDDTTRVNSVEVVGTLYTDADVPVGCESTHVNSGNLDPGQVSSFSVGGYYGRDYSDVTHYRLQADGTPQ